VRKEWGMHSAGGTGLGLAVKGLVEVRGIALDEALAADGMIGVVLVDAPRAENSAVNGPSIALVRNEQRSGLMKIRSCTEL
jgi:hypothetical protein